MAREKNNTAGKESRAPFLPGFVSFLTMFGGASPLNALVQNAKTLNMAHGGKGVINGFVSSVVETAKTGHWKVAIVPDALRRFAPYYVTYEINKRSIEDGDEVKSFADSVTNAGVVAMKTSAIETVSTCFLFETQIILKREMAKQALDRQKQGGSLNVADGLGNKYPGVTCRQMMSAHTRAALPYFVRNSFPMFGAQIAVIMSDQVDPEMFGASVLKASTPLVAGPLMAVMSTPIDGLVTSSVLGKAARFSMNGVFHRSLAGIISAFAYKAAAGLAKQYDEDAVPKPVSRLVNVSDDVLSCFMGIIAGVKTNSEGSFSSHLADKQGKLSDARSEPVQSEVSQNISASK